MSDALNQTGTFISLPDQNTPPEYAFLKERFGDFAVGFRLFRGDLSILLAPEIIEPAIRALRDSFSPAYNYLSYITADHWIEPYAPEHLTPPAFEVIYGLQSLPSPGTRLRLMVIVPDTPTASLPSVTSVYETANWHEREISDLFGIRFEGHPNLTRILTPETYPEHPLRRDFPHGGPELLDFQNRLIAQWNTAEERDYSGKFGDPWETKIIEQQEGFLSLRKTNVKYVRGEPEPPGDIAHEESIPDVIKKPQEKIQT